MRSEDLNADLAQLRLQDVLSIILRLSRTAGVHCFISSASPDWIDFEDKPLLGRTMLMTAVSNSYEQMSALRTRLNYDEELLKHTGRAAMVLFSHPVHLFQSYLAEGAKADVVQRQKDRKERELRDAM